MIRTPIPTPSEMPPIGRPDRNNARSIESNIDRTLKVKQKMLSYFMATADRINVPFTLAELQEPLPKKELKILNEKAKKMEDDASPARCTSAVYIGSDGAPLVFYLGRRLVDDKKKEKGFRIINLKDQYDGQTLEELTAAASDREHVRIFKDGLSEQQCYTYSIATQALAAGVRLKARDKTRHPGAATMAYETVSDSEDDMDISDEEPECEDINPDAFLKYEKAGLVHLVHGWIQQGQPNKGLFISRDMTMSSTALAACGSYYFQTQEVAKVIGKCLEVTFPESYKAYQKAFEAGVWMKGDPGPFLARAIIYKLQSRMHQDRHDFGPSVSFGVGKYTGGEMLLPQFGAKLLYSPGDLLIFYSSNILHQVAKFVPDTQDVQAKGEKILPGRTGTVFFFPKESFAILKDKPRDWGYQTAFGQNSSILDAIPY